MFSVLNHLNCHLSIEKNIIKLINKSPMTYNIGSSYKNFL